MEEIVNRQIEAVLDKNILHTKDVFIPEYPVEQQVDFENPDYEVFPPEIESKASELFALVKPAGYFECYDLKNAGEDYEMSLLQKGLTDEIRTDCRQSWCWRFSPAPLFFKKWLFF